MLSEIGYYTVEQNCWSRNDILSLIIYSLLINEFLIHYRAKNSFTRRVLILVNEQGVDRGDESGGGRGRKSMQTTLVQITNSSCKSMFAYLSHPCRGIKSYPPACHPTLNNLDYVFYPFFFCSNRAITMISKYPITPSLSRYHLFLPAV